MCLRGHLATPPRAHSAMPSGASSDARRRTFGHRGRQKLRLSARSKSGDWRLSDALRTARVSTLALICLTRKYPKSTLEITPADRMSVPGWGKGYRICVIDGRPGFVFPNQAALLTRRSEE